MKRRQLFGLRACQCGGRAAWVPCKPAVRRGRRASGQAERLACPACGNAVGPSASREKLAEEWNSAGWCGQAEALAELKPFGPGWRRETMRLKKADLVSVYEMRLRAGLVLARTVREQRARIEALEKEVVCLRSWGELAEVIDRLVQRGIVAKADAAGAKRRICAEGTGSRGGAEGAEKGGKA